MKVISVMLKYSRAPATVFSRLRVFFVVNSTYQQDDCKANDFREVTVVATPCKADDHLGVLYGADL
jgi:hypothetical protein